MNVYASIHCPATDAVRIHDRTDLGVTILETGPEHTGDHWQIKGTPADRIDFLHRLSAAATEAAYRVAVEAEWAEVGA